ncbi:hypothetical protein OG21DRAFT_1100634 [Imleria badia]|nr:hypothetical protein OG21DRAFT_1100634 [Imleria badia]
MYHRGCETRHLCLVSFLTLMGTSSSIGHCTSLSSELSSILFLGCVAGASVVFCLPIRIRVSGRDQLAATVAVHLCRRPLCLIGIRVCSTSFNDAAPSLFTWAHHIHCLAEWEHHTGANRSR